MRHERCSVVKDALCEACYIVYSNVSELFGWGCHFVGRPLNSQETGTRGDGDRGRKWVGSVCLSFPLSFCQCLVAVCFGHRSVTVCFGHRSVGQSVLLFDNGRSLISRIPLD